MLSSWEPEGTLRGVEVQLIRIADLLEGLLEATNPVNKLTEYMPSEFEPESRVSYSNEDDMIIEEKLRKMGKEYRPSTPRR